MRLWQWRLVLALTSFTNTRQTLVRAHKKNIKKAKHEVSKIEVVKKEMTAEDLRESALMVGRVLGHLLKVSGGGKCHRETMGRMAVRRHLTESKKGPPAKDASPERLFSEAKRLCRSKSKDDFKAAVELLVRAAALDHIPAHAWLGAAYDYGLGVRPNRRKAFEHYKIAAEAENANAQYHLGVFYHEGIGIKKNIRLAVFWLQRAVHQGDAEAMHLLGQCYRRGTGVTRSPVKGFKLELQAANKRSLEAQFSVGVCFSRGEGVVRSPEKAFTWFLAAARRGHDDAAFNVAKFYEEGRGVKKNQKRAASWFLRAQQLGEQKKSTDVYLQPENSAAFSFN